MQIHEKLRVMRQWKGWTQEALAEKLGCAVNTYAKIERGETTIKLDKLEQIAQVIGVDVQELIDANDKTVFNFAENCTHSNLAHTIVLTEAQCIHELEKGQLIIEQQGKEIGWLKEEIARLKEIIDLLKQFKAET